MRYTFEEIRLSSTKRGRCTVCDRPMVRRKTFWQTSSPFNRNLDGTVRTRDEIWEALNVEAAEWRDQPMHHEVEQAARVAYEATA